MRLLSSSILLFHALVLATSEENIEDNVGISVQTVLPTQPQPPQPNTETPEAYTTRRVVYPHHTPSLSSSIALETPPPSIHNLELRQAVGQAGGVAATTIALQQSPITTYLVRGPDGIQTPVPFTQLFSAVPDQWPSPTPGTIGLGTIQGQIGVVKTKTKRDAEPTGGVVEKIKRALAGGDHADSNRRSEPEKRASSVNAAAGKSVPWILGTVVVGLGLGVGATIS